MSYRPYTWEDTEEIAFDRTKKGRISGMLGNHTVYLNPKNCEDVREGDIWICRIERSSNDAGQPLHALPVELISRAEGEPEGIPVVDISVHGGCRLHSSEFRDGLYNVYASLDGTTLSIEPAEDGNISCHGNTLAISGLEFMIGSESRMLNKCRMVGDRIIVDLTCRADKRARTEENEWKIGG